MTSTTMELAEKYADVTGDYMMLDFPNVDDVVALNEARAELHQRIKELERDAKRYRWLHDNCTFQGEDGQIHIEYTCCFDHYDDLDRSIDRAMSEAALQKAVEISQEYKLP